MRRTPSVLAVSLVIVLSFVVPALGQTISWYSLDHEIGAGLQMNSAAARLSDDQHGGITVRIESSDTTLALVTADDLTPGTRYVDVFVPNGSTDATFYLQAFEDTTGTFYITATAAGFSAGLDSIDVVEPSLRIVGLTTSHDPYDPDDPFHIQVGVPNLGNTSLSLIQKVRVGGPGLTATISSSDGGVGQLVTTALTASVVTVAIAPGESSSPTSVGTGGVAFDGLSPGTTDVEATIPGFNQLTGNNPETLTVTTPIISMTTFPNDIGAGLQTGGERAQLSGTQHGGTTIHLESSDSNLVLLALNRYDAGTPTLDVFVPNGSSYTPFYVQALEDTTGVAVVTATAPGFANGVGTVNVLQPYFRINGLVSSIDTLDPNDTFHFTVGLPNGSFTSISPVQQTRGGGPGVTFYATSTPDSVGLIETMTTLDDSALVTIAPGESNSPTNVGAGGTAFDGVGAGVATVTADIPGFLPVSTGSVDVTVTQPVVTIGNNPSVGIGSGLRTSTTMRATLSASQHGGVTVHVEVADTNLGVISEHPDSVGVKSLDIFLANGSTLAPFYLHGKEDTTGVVTIIGSAPGFVTGMGDVDLVQPSIRITNSIALSKDTLDPPDPFSAQVGVTAGANFFGQPVRPGSPGVLVTASVDDSLVAELQTLADTSHTVTVLIAAGDDTSPSTFAAGGVAFNGLSPGVVDLSVSAPGFIQFTSAIKTITVTSPTVNMTGLSRVGAGLQTASYSLTLSASQHGGVLARIESLEPALALISDAVSTPGQAFIETFIPNGSTSTSFWVHGVDDTIGTATIVATAPLFIGETDSIDVVTPGVEIVSMPTTIDAIDPPNAFYGRVGLLASDNSDVTSYQNRRAGEPPLVVTMISSNGTVAEIVKTLVSDDTVTVQIPAGSYNSPTNLGSGGCAIDGLASGQTIVTAEIPGFITAGTGQRTVDVSNDNLYINGLASRLGKDLQSVAASAELGEPNHGGTTVRITVDDSTRAIVSANALVLGQRFIDIPLGNGNTEAVFYLQALDTGLVNVSATATAFNPANQDVAVVPAGVRIQQLADSMATTDPDDEFIVQVGAITPDSSDIETPQAVRGGGPSRVVDVSSSNGNLAFIVLGNDLEQSVSVTLTPGQFEFAAPVASGGLALTPWNVGTVTVTASVPSFVTTAAGMPDVVITGTPTDVGDKAPAVFALEQNVPNPFNPTTTIRFSLAAAGPVELVVYDVAGRRVATLVSRDMPAGTAQVAWDGTNDRGSQVASGVYFYRLIAGPNVQTRKMVLLK